MHACMSEFLTHNTVFGHTGDGEREEWRSSRNHSLCARGQTLSSTKQAINEHMWVAQREGFQELLPMLVRPDIEFH